jgi:hypothetical protein
MRMRMWWSHIKSSHVRSSHGTIVYPHISSTHPKILLASASRFSLKESESHSGVSFL